jgi:molybdopterin synthase sulfur carrier subunit
MSVVKIPPVLRPSVSGMTQVEVEGATVGEVLKTLADTYPDTADQLFSGDGELNRYVNVYVNDEDVRVQDGLATKVGESDTVVILPAMAGGCPAENPTTSLTGISVGSPHGSPIT